MAFLAFKTEKNVDLGGGGYHIYISMHAYTHSYMDKLINGCLDFDPLIH